MSQSLFPGHTVEAPPRRTEEHKKAKDSYQIDESETNEMEALSCGVFLSHAGSRQPGSNGQDSKGNSCQRRVECIL